MTFDWDHNAFYHRLVIRELPPPAQGYDAIVSVAVLHHLPAEQVVPSLVAALRPGGVLITAACRPWT